MGGVGAPFLSERVPGEWLRSARGGRSEGCSELGVGSASSPSPHARVRAKLVRAVTSVAWRERPIVLAVDGRLLWTKMLRVGARVVPISRVRGYDGGGRGDVTRLRPLPSRRRERGDSFVLGVRRSHEIWLVRAVLCRRLGLRSQECADGGWGRESRWTASILN